jgi:hypothetical protein
VEEYRSRGEREVREEGREKEWRRGRGQCWAIMSGLRKRCTNSSVKRKVADN